MEEFSIDDVDFLDFASTFASQSDQYQINNEPFDPELNIEPFGSSPTDNTISFAESNPSPTSTQTTLTPTFIGASPDQVVNVDFTRACQQRINLLADVMGAHYLTLNESEARIKRGLRELWQEHSDIRKRGLLGGTARAQARQKKYVPLSKIPEHDRARRLAVEQKDYIGRNRLAGIAKAREILEEAMWHLQDQQRKCEEIFGFEHKYNQGEAPWKEAQVV
ncbi:hypothetical protein B0A52_04939 [Exophiala mesophila]|uniref:Uncharacterized protein n=1 Tax=Exophiala mesophila TaxID=212818 RepID=A0A438N6V0_EXOME|nr:hypothetical protein B0A52_04939 [Exophiala mesophila]